MLQIITAVPKQISIPLHEKCVVRDTLVNYPVIHYDSSNNISSVVRYLNRERLSYNYFIQRDGTIVKLLNPICRASHAGISYWQGYFPMNEYSIGICLQNIPPMPYKEVQYQSLAWLIATLTERWPDIKEHKAVGHSQIAVPRGRKKDPGPKFDWGHLDSLLAKVRLS